MSGTVVKLGDLCTVVRGSSPRPKGDPRYYGGNVPRLMVRDVTRDGKFVTPKIDYLTKEGAEKSRPMKKGDFIIAVSGQPGQALILAVDACIHDGFAGLRDLDESKVSKDYLYHFMNFVKDKFSATAAGAIFKNLTTEQIRELEIPLPYPDDPEKSLKEQKRIAAILDKADGIRRKRKQTIQLADEFLLSFFLETFGDPVTNPKGWEIKKIEDVALKVTDGVHFKPNYIETGVPFISVKDITTGKLSFENTKFISLEDHENYIRRCNPEYMDILYTKVGATYGRPAIVDVKKDFSLYVSVCLIKPDHKKINAMFLTEVLATSALKRQADRSIKGAGVPDLHLIEIKKFILPVPSMKVQNDYVKKTRSVHKKIETYKESLRKIDDLFKSLSQKAFNGEL